MKKVESEVKIVFDSGVAIIDNLEEIKEELKNDDKNKVKLYDKDSTTVTEPKFNETCDTLLRMLNEGKYMGNA